MGDHRVLRLGPADVALARATFALLVDAFDEGPARPLAEAYVEELLCSATFWVFAALVDRAPVGGLTAHRLPMTRAATSELFVYDLAVRPDHRRRGVASALLHAARVEARAAGIENVFVPAESDDAEAVAFYRAQPAEAAAVTVFTFTGDPGPEQSNRT